MTQKRALQVVDLFAGPGGLGEGFSALDQGSSFKVLVSAEMDPAAHSTLRLRAFYRALRRNNSDALDDYYKFCEAEKASKPWTQKSKAQWEEAEREARMIRLGSEDGNVELDKILASGLKKQEPWVLIGGPPCQAYSLVGRSRNKGKVEYKPEDDHRHYLYKEYLRIIQKNKPAVFVMENVKGILSSKVAGELIFPQILQDLADPDVALGFPSSKFGKYKIVSLVSDEVFESGDDPKKIKLNKFTIKSEDFGIPQSRHRVILVGVSEKYADGVNKQRLHISDPVTIEECIGKLPRIRSKISKGKDNDEIWSNLVLNHVGELLKSLVGIEAACPKLLGEMIVAQSVLRKQQNLSCGKTRLPRPGYIADDLDLLHEWLEDDQLTVWLNHESRKHMSADLRRYVYASIFAAANNRSPKGHDEFNGSSHLRV